MVLQFYASYDATVKQIVGTSPQSDSAYEKAIHVLQEAQKKVDSWLRDKELSGLRKDCQNRVRSLESNCMVI